MSAAVFGGRRCSFGGRGSMSKKTPELLLDAASISRMASIEIYLQ